MFVKQHSVAEQHSVAAGNDYAARSRARLRGSQSIHLSFQQGFQNESHRHWSGLGGLGLRGACAVELADNGYEVTVLEKRPVLGGRVSSWLDKDGDWVETAPHVIRGSYKSFISLLERVGIADRVKWKKQQLLYASKGGKMSSVSFSPSAGPVEILRSLIGSDLLGFGDKLKLLTGLLPAFTGDGSFIENQDAKSFADWAAKIGVNREAVERFFDPLSRTVSFLRPDEVSARVIIFQMASIAQGLNATRIGFLDGDPAQRLFEPIADYLRGKGAVIRTNARLGRIDFDNDRPHALGLELTNGERLADQRRAAGGRLLRFGDGASRPARSAAGASVELSVFFALLASGGNSGHHRAVAL